MSFPGHMKILMANGTYKPISNLKVNDTVLCYAPYGHLTTDIITHFIPNQGSGYDIAEFADGTMLVTIGKQCIYDIAAERFRNITDWEKNDKAYNYLGHNAALEKLSHLASPASFYSFFTEKYNNYFVNGIWCGNCFASTTINPLNT